MANFDDDIAADYRHEQNYFNSLSAIPRAPEGMIPRLFKGMDCPDSTTCDIVYIDMLTGKEVMRYDGADPANTRFDYGATPDADILARKGYDIKEMIDPAKAVITLEACRKAMRISYDDYDWGPYDD